MSRYREKKKSSYCCDMVEYVFINSCILVNVLLVCILCCFKLQKPEVKSEPPAVKTEHKTPQKSSSHGDTKVKKEETPTKMETDKSYASGSESGSNSNDSRLAACLIIFNRHLIAITFTYVYLQGL